MVKLETNPSLISGGSTWCAIGCYHWIPDLQSFSVHGHNQIRIVIQHSANSVRYSNYSDANWARRYNAKS